MRLLPYTLLAAFLPSVLIWYFHRRTGLIDPAHARRTGCGALAVIPLSLEYPFRASSKELKRVRLAVLWRGFRESWLNLRYLGLPFPAF